MYNLWGVISKKLLRIGGGGGGRFENLLSFLKMAGTSLTGNKQPAPVPLDENVVENGSVNIVNSLKLFFRDDIRSREKEEYERCNECHEKNQES